ncbi:hypothetical protein JTE90_018218 [Oedothorax gibbosus]|uniref:Uncharacterized protein n=1 Tax=Oedothorax gibbosus TaxID=931172 RepID=A0AAV6U8M4_9ARAC|nr:hypothetical protein JTE90_018218 [Oedothorax gibbosus]
MSAAVVVLRRRRKCKIERYRAVRGNAMDLSEREFIKKFRLSKLAFLHVCDMLQGDLHLKTTGYSVELQCHAGQVAPMIPVSGADAALERKWLPSEVGRLTS